MTAPKPDLLDAIKALADEGFVGSSGAMSALFDAYERHIGIAETEPPEGIKPYMWCACGWRSDQAGETPNPGRSYALHLTNEMHAAIVRPIDAQWKNRINALLAGATTSETVEGGGESSE